MTQEAKGTVGYAHTPRSHPRRAARAALGAARKQFATCSAKFGNGVNFRGFPHMPGEEAVLRYNAHGGAPDQPGQRCCRLWRHTCGFRGGAGIWEVLQFGLATIVSTGRWKLTRLLRGQSGTEDAIVPSALIGIRIVFLGASLVPLPVSEAELGMPWNWRIGPVGRAAGDAINLALAFTPQGRGLRPWSPVRIKGVWNGSGDITLSWLRRTRSLAGDSWNAPEVPLGEASETYDVEILNGGGSVMRTGTGFGLAVWTYTAAMQATDFGALVTSLRLRIFQNGQLGRGAPAEAILTP